MTASASTNAALQEDVKSRKIQIEEGLTRYPEIPSYMHRDIIRYVVDRRLSGNFLTAIVSNDLQRAFAYGDSANIKALHSWVKLMYNWAPAECWGREEVVAEWIEGKDIVTEDHP
jgi:hypothetical protein